MLTHVSRALLAPRYWPSWLGFLLWYLISQLPYRVQYLMAKAIAPLLKYNRQRMHWARVNIDLCFPELSEAERQAILDESRFSTAMAIFETGIAWFWPKWRLRRLYRIHGEEHLRDARAAGQGALLLSMHFTHLDIGSAMLGQHTDYDGMYSPHKNPVYDAVQKSRREAYCPGITIPRDNVRLMISRLRQGRMIWYAPDRDLGPKVSIFVPFFGVPAATVTATGKFAQMGRARVIPFTQYRLPGGKGYDVTIHPPFENYPTGDEFQDALRVNQFIESQIRQHPGQYLWAQPRFKTRPEGEAKVYKRRHEFK